MTIDEIVNAISALDDEADVMRAATAVNERVLQLRQRVREAVASGLKVGQRVRINSRISPKYLIGLTGTVAEPPGTDRVSVQLDHPALARRFASEDGIAQVGLGAIEILTDE